MRSRLLRRRSATAVWTYASALLGFLGTVVAARALGPHDFGLFALVVVAAGFFQTLLDLTAEEAVVKFGFRYSAQGDWGRLRRLFRGAAMLKGAGAALAGLALVALAPLADGVFGAGGLTVPLLVAALLPLAYAPEGLAGSALFLRERYDVRSFFLALSMALRLVALAIGARYGVVEAVAGLVLAQAAASSLVAAAGWTALRGFPAASPAPLGRDRGEITRFVLQSSAATGVVSLRSPLGPLVLGIVATPVQVAFFRAAQAPQQGFASLSAPARMVLLTEQTRDWERGARMSVFAGIRRYSLGAAALMALALPPLLWFMPDLIRIVYGASFSGATDAARIVLVAAALQFVYGWTKSFPVSIGRPNLRVLAHGVETLVLIPLVAVLGAAYGATGASGAVLASTAAFAALWTILFTRLRRQQTTEPPQSALASEAGTTAAEALVP